MCVGDEIDGLNILNDTSIVPLYTHLDDYQYPEYIVTELNSKSESIKLPYVDVYFGSNVVFEDSYTINNILVFSSKNVIRTYKGVPPMQSYGVSSIGFGYSAGVDSKDLRIFRHHSDYMIHSMGVAGSMLNIYSGSYNKLTLCFENRRLIFTDSLVIPRFLGSSLGLMDYKVDALKVES
jgi:hypothetical protein